MLFLFFAFIPHFNCEENEEIEEFEYFGRKIQIYPKKKSILSFENSWYFVNLRNFYSNENHQSFNLNITNINIITNDWHRLFLTPDQAYKITSEFSCPMKPFDEDDKNLGINIFQNLFFAEFHPSFVPFNSPKTQFKQLFRTIYEINTTEIDRILSIPELLFICDAPNNRFHNRWASGITQHYGAPTMTKDGFKSSQYLKEHNITGRNQVLTIVDGGLDISNSFFYDSEHPFQYNSLNRHHKKVIYYDTYGNQYDSQSGGHGTHVAGTAAGKSMCGNSNSLYDGAAPDAHIHFIDIGHDDESRKLLNLPITIVFTEMGLTGSYVSTNSWGSSSRNYGQTRLYDMTANYMRDRLFVFSAGNDGESGYLTVNSPSDSKNILSVGALDLTLGQMYEQTTKYTYTLVVEDQNGNQKRFTANYVSGPKPMETTKGIFRIPASRNPQSNSVFVTSSPSSVCSLSPAPLAAVIASTISPSCKVRDYTVYKSDGNVNDILSASKVTIEISISSGFYNPSVASYSSRGPSYFGINKPDVVAPGTDIKSANSRSSGTSPGHGCSISDLAVKSGTSMACPNIGGLATLVTQYFIDGYYPSGKYNEKDGFIPGSSLVRALIVSSAEKLSGSWTPDSNYGHGIPSIDNVLTFDKNLKVFKDVEISQNEDMFFRFRMSKPKNSKQLRITMAYIDEPDQSDNAILIVDIDMYLVTPKGRIIYGNSKGNHEEHLSTIEKIVVENNEIEEGEYQLHFFGGGRINVLRTKKALFSFCVSGPLEGSSIYDIESHDASGVTWEMKNVDDVCEFPKTGLHCQLEAVEVSEGSSLNVMASSEAYFYFKVPANWSNLTIIMNKPRDVRGRMIYQFSSQKIHRNSYNYEKTLSSFEPEFHISMRRSDFQVKNHTFIGARINNLCYTSIPLSLRFVYDEYVPPVPKATTPPATWKISYLAGVAAGYGLLTLTVIMTVFLIIIFVFKYKELKRLQRVSNNSSF